MREIDWVPRGERERCRREGRELRRIDRAGESLLASAMGVATDQAMERLEEDDAFQGMLGCVDRIERRILEWRFVEDMTLAEIGASLGITESRISQMLREMMPRLKNELIRKGFRDGSCEDEVCETDNGR
jgi:RNA polymerase sigma factor (sigma-70 family)